jgi:uncharacterized protein YecE (DUF72 family)
MIYRVSSFNGCESFYLPMINRNSMTVLVGCSGWSYDDWVGRFYPLYLAKRKEEWLRYYAQFFKTVEINSTFYRPPSEFLVRSWISKASSLGEFEFSVKVPQLITHDSLVNGKVEAAVRQARSFEEICIAPLAKEDLLGVALIQLSPYFKYGPDSILSLTTLLSSVACDRYRYAIEFRHRSWIDDSGSRVVGEVIDLLKKFNVALVVVDGPGFPFIDQLTSYHSYIRFHGRNYDIWFDDEKEDDFRINRYDYLYSEDQLEPWKERIKKMQSETKEIRVYFNNHGSAKAVKNALQMMDLLSIPHREKEVHVQNQMKLGTFNSNYYLDESEMNHNFQISRSDRA